jgi:hypothetical protein
MKFPTKRLFVLSLASLITLVTKAYVFLPIPQRGIEGHGLYRFINGLQFFETAVFTTIVVFWISFWLFKLHAHWSILLGIAYSSINFGIMIFDARIHQYTPWVEKTIKSMYGSKLFILTLAPVPIFIGILMIYFASKNDGLITRAFSGSRGPCAH